MTLTNSTGFPSVIVLSSSDGSYVFLLEIGNPTTGAVRALSGFGYSAPQDGGPGALYCVGAGSISDAATPGAFQQIDFGQFSKLGACVQDKSNSVDIACN
jgi:hypothetical protein